MVRGEGEVLMSGEGGTLGRRASTCADAWGNEEDQGLGRRRRRVLDVMVEGDGEAVSAEYRGQNFGEMITARGQKLGETRGR